MLHLKWKFVLLHLEMMCFPLTVIITLLVVIFSCVHFTSSFCFLVIVCLEIYVILHGLPNA
jgi:hypothetical protein